MPTLPARVARRVYRQLPEAWRAAIRAWRTARSYSLNTRTLGPNEHMLRWFDAHKRPVSIVIPSYNDVPLLAEALDSISRTVIGIEYEVIIVDDYIDAAVSAQLKEFESDRVRVVLKSERRGFAGTVNVGMSLARYDIVLLNSDIVAKPGWLEALQYSAYALDPSIGMVSGMLVYPDGRIQYAGTYYARLLAPQWFGHFHVGSPATRATAQVPGYNRAISGACVYITRWAFDTVGLLDDEFWLGFEDVDYGLRAWQLGVRCYYQPAALLVHHESASRGYSQGYRELASMRRFWRRWEDAFLARRIPPGAPVSFVAGPGSVGIWSHYVEELANALRATGRDVMVHVVAERARNENLIADLASRGGLVVATDWSVAETVWLATANGGVPVYLLPSVESAAYPDDAALQASIIAGYRPEFDYVAPNRVVQRQLQAEAAWEPRARIAPALQPPAELPAASDRIVVTGLHQAERSAVSAVAGEFGLEVEDAAELIDGEELDRIRRLAPRVVVSGARHVSSLVPFALMSLGAVYMAPSDPTLSHEVLDGYNALLFDRGDTTRLAQSLRDVLTHRSVWEELRANGHASAVRAARMAASEFSRALDSFAERSV